MSSNGRGELCAFFKEPCPSEPSGTLPNRLLRRPQEEDSDSRTSRPSLKTEIMKMNFNVNYFHQKNIRHSKIISFYFLICCFYLLKQTNSTTSSCRDSRIMPPNREALPRAPWRSPRWRPCSSPGILKSAHVSAVPQHGRKLAGSSAARTRIGIWPGSVLPHLILEKAHPRSCRASVPPAGHINDRA